MYLKPKVLFSICFFTKDDHRLTEDYYRENKILNPIPTPNMEHETQKKWQEHRTFDLEHWLGLCAAGIQLS